MKNILFLILLYNLLQLVKSFSNKQIYSNYFLSNYNWQAPCFRSQQLIKFISKKAPAQLVQYLRQNKIINIINPFACLL